METLWFAILWGMLTVYVILDGFDFGVGILHLFVAKTIDERKTMLAAIGPIWDGNEVWLIASGGVLFMAFPKAYATIFSGFYMALMIVLWLLILRGAAIELRIHNTNMIWQQFWDSVFSIASTMLAIVFGVTLGNLVRGVPLDSEGLAGMPLFTNFLPNGDVGILDWYTLLVGLFTMLALAIHGAMYLCWRTSGNIQDRSRKLAMRLWWAMTGLWVIVTLATAGLRWEVFSNLWKHPWSFAFVAIAFGGVGGVLYSLRSNRDLSGFAASCLFLLGLLGASAIGNYPYFLRSTVDPSFDLTAVESASSSMSLKWALGWWTVSLILVCGYFTFLFYWIRNKVESPEYEHHV